MADIDYRSIEIPPDETPEKYHYTARRADILRRIREAGHPRAFSQRELADRYGCSVGTINNDMNEVAEYVDDTLGSREALSGDMLFGRAIDELIDQGEWREATRVFSEWHKWQKSYRDREELEERIEEIEEKLAEL